MPSPRSAVAATNRIWAAGLLGLFIAVALVGLRMASHSGPPIFILPEKKFVDASTAPPELLPLGDSGYDGQFVWRLAHDPFTTDRTGDSVTIDNPPYRQQRILLPLIAHLVPVANKTRVLVGINVLAVSACCVAGAMLARAGGRHALWGVVAGCNPAVLIGLARTLNEPLATALLLFAIALWMGGSRAGPAVLFALAALARETTLACVVGLGVVALVRRDKRAIVACLVPGVVEFAWQLDLWQVWGSLPWTAGGGNLGTPILGPIGDVFNRHPTAGFKVFAYEFFRITLLAAIAVSVFARRVSPGLRGFALGGAALALSLGAWEKDVAFLRAAAEVWLGALVLSLLTRSSRLTTAFLTFAIPVSLFAGYRFTAGLAQ